MNNLKKIKKKSISILLILGSFAVAYAQTSQLKVSTEAELKENINIAPCKNEERLDAVKKLFRQMGAEDSDISVEKYKDTQNIVVKKKGKTGETVIVGAHYDKVKDGCGAIDNWTGIVLVANLYRTLKDVPTDKTYEFVAFDKEELGLLGSSAMAKEIPKEKRVDYCSMVNFDSFGFGYPQVLDNASNSKMTNMAADLAKELQMPFSHFSLAGTADADSSSFKDKDIPAITFSGLSSDWQKYLHTKNDQIENINVSSVLVGYQFSLRYLLKLDAAGCSVFRK